MVPNVVHYIMLRPDDASADGQDMTFLQYLSFLGVHQHIRPTHILIHGNVLPRGEWWRRTADEVANIYFVDVTNVPTVIYGRQVIRVEHRTDLLRYRILYGNYSATTVGGKHYVFGYVRPTVRLSVVRVR